MDLSFSEHLTAFLQRWGELDFISATVVAAIIIILSLIPIPRSGVNIVIGAVFGFPVIPVIVLSNAAGAALPFLLARYFLAARLRRLTDRNPKLRAVMNAVDSEGWRIVALLRLGGPLPGVMQNYLYGLTRIPLTTCTVMTLIFAIPQIWVHVYLGSLGRDALEQRLPNPDFMLGAVTCLVTITGIALITHRMRAALKAAAATATRDTA